MEELRSKNTFYQKEDYWIMVIQTKGTVHEKDFNGQEIEILFDGEEEVVNKIRNTTWYLNKPSNGKSYTIGTGNYNKEGKHNNLHKVVYGEVEKGKYINYIRRDNDNWKDVRKSNLKSVELEEISKNRTGAGFPTKRKKGWYYRIRLKGCLICTPTRESYDEADLDALITQQYFNYTHRQNEWYKIQEVSEEYKRNLISIMEEKYLRISRKKETFTKNNYKIIDNDTIKIYDNLGNYCLVDIEDLWILEQGRVSKSKSGYWYILKERKKIKLYRFIFRIENNEFREIHIDHLNHNPNDNRKENLIITTFLGNSVNKKGKGYTQQLGRYKTQIKDYWEYIKKHDCINKTKQPYFDTQAEAWKEGAKRKWLIKHIRPQFKDLEEYLEFKKEFEEQKNETINLDDYWIQVKFKDINEIKIPNNLEECEEK